MLRLSTRLNSKIIIYQQIRYCSRNKQPLSILDKTKDVLHHTWTSSKLFATEISTTTSLVKDMIGGSLLNRREKRQIVRTGTDVLRLVPFSLFLIIPFMEFLLPFAVRIFPGLLPSPFRTDVQKQDAILSQAQARLETAKILRQILNDLTVTTEQTDDNMIEILDKVRNKHTYDLSQDDILKLAKRFKSDITLDNMNRSHLVAMCRHLSLPAFGPVDILRYQLRSKIKDIIEDDRLILWEGVDSLEKDELQQACLERGIPFMGLTKEKYRDHLSIWLDMSMNKNVSPSLLLLTRAFSRDPFSEETFNPDAIADVIHQIDVKVVDEVKLDLIMDSDNQMDKLETVYDLNEKRKDEEQKDPITVSEMIQDIEIERSKGKVNLEQIESEEIQDVTTAQRTKKVLSKVLDSLKDDVSKLKSDTESK